MSYPIRGLLALVPSMALALELTVVAPTDPLTTTSVETARAATARQPGGAGVVAAEDYRTGRSTTWSDMLRQATGVSVQPRFGAEESRLSIRGSGLQRTFHMRGILVLQDGIPVSLADGGGDFQATDPTLLDHLVVYRGANGAALGSATLGGAIDARSPTGRTPGATRLSAEGGSFDYLRGTATAGSARGNLDTWLGATAWQAQGWRRHSQTQSQRISANVGLRLADGIENRTFLGYSNSVSELPGSLTRAEVDADPRQAKFLVADQHRDYPLVRVANRTVITRGGQRLELSGAFSWKSLDHPLWFGSAFAPSYIVQRSRDGLVSLAWSATEGTHRWAVRASHGVGLVRDERYLNVNGARGVRRDDNRQRSTTSLFDVQDGIHLGATTLTPGCQWVAATRRFDDRQFSGTDPDRSDEFRYHQANPRFGVLHDLEGHQVFASIARSFEAPSFGELVAVGNTVGLLDLEAQDGVTAEIGSRGDLDDLRWDVTLYHAWLRHELLSYSVGPGQSRTLNADRTRHAGLEAGADALAAGWLRLRANYLWSWFRFDDDPQFGSHRIAGVPDHHLALESLVERHGWYAGPTTEVNARTWVDHANTTEAAGWVLLGAKAGYRVTPGAQVWIEGRNLLDTLHIATFSPVTQAGPSSAIYNPGDGRAFYAGAGWSW